MTDPSDAPRPNPSAHEELDWFKLPKAKRDQLERTRKRMAAEIANETVEQIQARHTALGAPTDFVQAYIFAADAYYSTGRLLAIIAARDHGRPLSDDEL